MNKEVSKIVMEIIGIVDSLADYTRELCIHNHTLIAILIAANFLIFLAYTIISSTVAWLMLNSRVVPFPVIWVLSGGFIISCGLTHLCGVLVFFQPAYYLEAGICSFTALISCVTAILLYKERHLVLTALRDSSRLSRKIDLLNAAKSDMQVGDK